MMRLNLSDIFQAGQQVTDTQLLHAVLVSLDDVQIDELLGTFQNYPAAYKALKSSLEGWGWSDRDRIVQTLIQKKYQSDPKRKNLIYVALTEYAKKAGLKFSTIYQAIGLERTRVSKLKNKPGSNIGRDNALRLVIVLKMNYFEAVYWMGLNGYGFNPMDPREMCVIDCIHRGIYEQDKIDLLLYDRGLKTLFSEE